MIPEKLKARLKKGRVMTTVTLRVPLNVVDSLKTIAPHKGKRGYKALLKAYIGEGLRCDEAVHLFGPAAPTNLPIADALVQYAYGDLTKEQAIEQLGLRDYAQLLVRLGEANLALPTLPAHELEKQAKLFVELWGALEDAAQGGFAAAESRSI